MSRRVTPGVARPRAARRSRPANPYDWLVEPLSSDPTYFEKCWFGFCACYLDGRLVLVMARSGEEPWNGVLVPTDHAHHVSLLGDHPALVRHAVLGKWLYLPESRETFEERGRELVELVRRRDARIGIEPGKRRARRPRRRFGR